MPMHLIDNTSGVVPQARELWLSIAEAARILGLPWTRTNALLDDYSRWMEGERRVPESVVRAAYGSLNVEGLAYG